MTEQLPIDVDPPRRRRGRKVSDAHVVTVAIDVPPKAVSHGWGDMSWLDDR